MSRRAVYVIAGLWFRKMSSAAAAQKPLIAVAQMTSTADKEQNFSTCSRLIREASARRACMVFLPEACDYIGSSTEETLSLAETLQGDLIQRYSRLARDCGVWLSLGGFHEKGSGWDEDRRISNSHVILDSEGHIVSVYRKTHLFDVELQSGVTLRESAFTVPGAEIVPPVSTPGGKVRPTQSDTTAAPVGPHSVMYVILLTAEGLLQLYLTQYKSPPDSLLQCIGLQYTEDLHRPASAVRKDLYASIHWQQAEVVKIGNALRQKAVFT